MGDIFHVEVTGCAVRFDRSFFPCQFSQFLEIALLFLGTGPELCQTKTGTGSQLTDKLCAILFEVVVLLLNEIKQMYVAPKVKYKGLPVPSQEGLLD